MPTRSDTPSVLANLRSANREAQARYLRDLEKRQRASTILDPNEVAGEYDAGRMLTTTLGGAGPRMITHDDIRAFRANVKTAGKKFKGGITAKAVIDMSRKEDRDRSNQQIRTAVPVQSSGGRVHFITNAGPNSEVTRHHVHIELLNFDAAVSSPSKISDMAKFLASGPLKFDCDCGRHRYWFRYIATIGNFAAGRPETGFPKIRNPGLHGVACKHVLRVMQQLGQQAIRLKLEQIIAKARGEVDRKAKLTTAKEAREIAAKQDAQGHWKRNKVETSAERAMRLAQGKAVTTVVERQVKQAKQATPTALSKSIAKLTRQIQTMASAGLLTKSQVSAMLAAIQKK